MAGLLYVGRHGDGYVVSRMPETSQSIRVFFSDSPRVVLFKDLTSLLLNTVEMSEDLFTEIVSTLRDKPAAAWIRLSSEQVSRLMDIGL